MFWKRKPAPPQAANGSGDRQLDAARAALAARQERIAQLELDLLNSHNELAAFNAEIERRLGPLQRRLEAPGRFRLRGAIQHLRIHRGIQIAKQHASAEKAAHFLAAEPLAVFRNTARKAVG